MRKFRWGCSAIAAGMILWIAAAYSQDDMTHVATDVFDDPQRPAALFAHEDHNAAAELDDCGECHHVYDDAGNRLTDETSEDMRCADCHATDASDPEEPPPLMEAYHTNCKGCHLERKAGPVMCGECHRRS